MNVENILTWYRMLKSGEYNKATGHLHLLPYNDTPGGYCAIGVGCHVAGILETTEYVDGTPRRSGSFGNERESMAAPREFIEWTGIDEDSVLWTIVTRMNDGSKWTKTEVHTHSQIADRILELLGIEVPVAEQELVSV